MDRNKTWTNLALGIAAAVFGVGIWIGYNAWLLASVSFGLWATALILTAPGIAVASLKARHGSLGYIPGAAAPQLIDCIERADLLLRAIRLARASIFIAISYAVVLWFCQLSGMISARTFVQFYTVICAAAAAAYLPWLDRHEKPAQADRENCRILLAEFKMERSASA